MHRHIFQKSIAAIAAGAIAATSFAVLPSFSASAATTILSSDFSNGTSGWSTYKASGGSCSMGVENGKLALTVNSVGTLNYSVQVGYDVVPLYQNGVYRLKYDISSTEDCTVEQMIQQNGGTYQSYTWKGLDLTAETQTVDYTFTMKQETDIMSKLVFNCGYEGKDVAPHTIYLDNVSLELIDDSKVDYTSFQPYEPSIITDQVGYQSNSKKTAVFRDVTSETTFSVVNADTKQTVYTGTLSDSINNSPARETEWTGDFSAVTEPGSYYITCGDLDQSYTFTISDDVYDTLLTDSVKMLYLQRCGTEIEDDTFGHVACHNTKATIYGTSETIDVSGGWHDAGDYGRYVVPGAKTVADLLYAYAASPSSYGDATGIPESGNGVPDILDETRYELEWMLKMQDAKSGGVHHKVTCENFPGYVMPENETDALIVTPITTTATADFCASMAMAYEFYQDVDPNFANTCLNAAKKAWDFLEENPKLIYENPEDITTGAYEDTSDTDERYWAAMQMYRATGDESYLQNFIGSAAKTGMDWSTVGDYGNIAILTMANPNQTMYAKAKKAVLKEADQFVSTAKSSPYGVSVVNFNWGSNMTVANAGVILGLAYQLTDDTSYLNVSASNLHYLLGSNPIGECFVTGFGTVSPQNPHHRPSMAKKQAMHGMVVGGVNSNLEDSAAKAYLATTAPAKCYVDHSESYSTNEIAIYWNSPLTYLISLNNANTGNTGTVGDVNQDGAVNVADVILLQKYLIRKATLTAEQGVNADMTKDNIVNVVDLCLLKKNVLKNNSNPSQPDQPTKPDQPSTNKPDPNATMYANFREGSTKEFIASDGWTNGNPFDCVWKASNATFKDNALNLTIDKDPTGQYHYTGAEYRTNDFYSYGYYETSMQAIKNDGVVSSFFTYTGPSDNNPWDEIDVEVLGKDTTKVQFNYYTNGVGNHEYMYDLGFDASEGYHTYGFDWQKDSITWYVDGKAVYTATSNIPSTPGKIMMNVWPGIGVDDWLKPFDGTTPLTAKYQWVTYRKAETSSTPDTPSGNEPAANTTMYANFRTGSTKEFIASDGWTNGNPFDCFWKASNATFKDNALNLTIDKDPTGQYHYTGAEYRTNDFYSYGYYETSMQAIKNDGVVSSFFTYTGPSDNNPWDEIDVEVLGKDTTKVQFNYYTNGVGNHEYMYDLGFDASEGYHTYGFDWQKDSITWYVDGKAVYKATSNIPSTPGKIMMNVWPGIGVDDWLKPFDGTTPLTAKYQWVTYNENGHK